MANSLRDIAHQFDEQLASGDTITVNDAVLGTAGVDELLRKSLDLPGAAGLSVVVPAGKVPDPSGGKLTFSGQVSFLALQNQTAELTFLENGSFLFDLTVSLPDEWAFGDSFPDLTLTPLQKVPLVSDSRGPRAQLVFCTADEKGMADAPNPWAGKGLSFNGTLGVEGPFDILLELLGRLPKSGADDAAPLLAAPLRGQISLVKLKLPAGHGGAAVDETGTGTETRLEAVLLGGDQPRDGLTIGPITVKDVYAGVTATYATVAKVEEGKVDDSMTDDDETIDATTVEQQTAFVFGGDTVAFEVRPLRMEVAFLNRTNLFDLAFYSPDPGQTILSLDDLVKLLGRGADWQEKVPKTFSQESGIFTFGLQRATVRFNHEKGKTPSIVSKSATLGITRPWTVYQSGGSGPSFVVDELGMGFAALTTGPGQTFYSGDVGATFSILRADGASPMVFDVSFAFSSGRTWLIGGAYRGAIELTLGQLNSGIFTGATVPDPGGDTFASIGFSVPRAELTWDHEQKKATDFHFETLLTAELDLFGERLFQLQSGELAVDAGLAPVQLKKASLTGDVSIADLGFFISATVTPGAMQLRGSLVIDEPIDLMRFVGQLLPGSLPAPGLPVKVLVTELSLEVDTGKKTYEISGALDVEWGLSLGENPEPFGVVEVKATVSSEPGDAGAAQALWLAELGAEPAVRAAVGRHQLASYAIPDLMLLPGDGAGLEPGEPLPVPLAETGGRTYEVELSGKLTLTDKFTVDVSYSYSKDKQVVRGTWKKSAGQEFDYTAVAGAMKIPGGDLKLPASGLPDFGMKSLELMAELSDEKKLFQLAGTSDSGDKGLFLAQKNQKSWGFAVGLRLPAEGWVITRIPGLADFLEGFGFQSASVLVSSFSDNDFTNSEFPLPQGVTKLSKGFNFYAEFDLGGNKNEAIQFARGKVIRSDAPSASLFASVAEGKTGLDATFEARLDAHRKISGTFAFENLDLGFSIAGKRFTVWISLELSAEVWGGKLYFGGQAEVRNQGFDAIVFLDATRFPGGVWRDAFGVSGLTVGNAALMLGVDEGGIPSFGISGELFYKEFHGFVAAILDSQTADPAKNQSMFAASVSDFTLGALVGLLTGGAQVDSGIGDVLDSIGIRGTPLFDVPGLTEDDVRTLNRELQVPHSLMSAFKAKGFALPATGSQLTPTAARWRELIRREIRETEAAGLVHRFAADPQASEAYKGVVVAPQATDPGAGGGLTNLRWFVTDRTRARTYTVVATKSGGSYSVDVRLDAQLYLVPNQITLPHFPPLEPGYHFNGQLEILGVQLWVWVTVKAGLRLPAAEEARRLPPAAVTAASTATESAGFLDSGIQLAAFLSPIDLGGGMIVITQGNDFDQKWFQQRMAKAKAHQLHGDQPLPDGPMISLSTMTDDGAPAFLREPHLLIAGGFKLFKVGDGKWLVEAQIFIAILKNGFRFNVEVELLGAVKFQLSCTFEQVSGSPVALPEVAGALPPAAHALLALPGSPAALAGAGDDIRFNASGRFTLDLGSVNLPDVGSLLPGGKVDVLKVQVGLAVAHEPGQQETKISLTIEFKVFGIGFDFTIPVEVPFLADIVQGVKDFIEDAVNVGQVFANILFGDSAFGRWLGSVLGGFLDGAIQGNAKYLAAAMNYFKRGAAEAAALIQAFGFGLDAAKAAIKLFEGDPKELEDLVERVFGLHVSYLGAAQRFGPHRLPTKTGLPEKADFDTLLAWMTGTAKGDAQDLIKKNEWAGLFAGDAQWLLLMQLEFLAFLDIGVVFYDPSLASLKLQVKIPGTSIELTLEITYQRLTDDLGVYLIETSPPSGWGQQRFGPVELTIPRFQLSIYTNGNFLVDVGFPFKDDWSRCMQVSLPPLSGAGGFYFGALSSATSDIFPRSLGLLNPIIAAGVGLKLGYSRSLNLGILSGGVDASFTGVIQGAIGFQAGSGNFLATPRAIALKGQLAVAGSVYGSVDFGIAKGSINISISLAVGFSIVTGEALVFDFRAHVEVTVKVRISVFFGHITIGLPFRTTVHVHISIPWSGADLLEEAPEPVAFLSGDALRAMSWPGASPAAMAAGDRPILTVYFSPEVTVLYEKAARGLRPTPYCEAGLVVGYEPGDAGSAFNRLAAAAAHWTLSSASEEYRETGWISRGELRQVAGRLLANKAEPRRYRRPGAGAEASESPTAVNYDKLKQFLTSTFRIEVAVPTAAVHGVPFPIIPDLVLDVTGRDPEGETWPRDFSTYGEKGEDWLRYVEQYFEKLRVLGGTRAAAADDEDAAQQLPVCEYLFVDYFQTLIHGAANQLEQLLEEHGADGLTADDVAAVDYRQLAGNLTQVFRNGLRLPDAAGAGSTSPLYQLTGQQFATRNQPDTAYSLTLKAGAGGDWFTVRDAAATLDTAALEGLLRARMPAPLAERPVAGPYFEEKPRSYPLTNLVVWSEATAAGRQSFALSGFPPGLTDALAAAGDDGIGADLLQRQLTGNPDSRPTPIDVATAQAAEIGFTVRKVPGSAATYQMSAVDPRQLAVLDSLVRALAAGEARDLTASLLYSESGKSGLFSGDAAAADIVFLRTNLTTETAPPTEVPDAFLAEAEREPAVAADLSDVPGVAEILQAYSFTNAAGTYVYYEGGLPDAAFGGTDQAQLTLLAVAPRHRAGGAEPVTLRPWFNALVLGPTPADELRAFDNSSRLLYFAQATAATGLVERLPTVSPGVLPVELTRTVPDPDADPGPQATLESLYSLLSFRIVAGDGFEGSVAAIPAGPSLVASGGGTATWSYRLNVPVHRYWSGGEDPNPYAGIGHRVGLELFVRDAFGNDLPVAGEPHGFDYLYTDPLLPVSNWPGVSLTFDFEAEHASAVLLTLSVDTGSLSSLSPAGLEQAAARAQKAAHQVAGPAVRLLVSSTLGDADGPSEVGSARAPYVPGSPSVGRFAGQLVAYLRGLGSGSPVPAPDPCVIALERRTPLSVQEPAQIGALFTIERASFVDPAVARRVEEVGRVESAASPAAVSGEALLGMAASFAGAFPGYVLATGPRSTAGKPLFAVATQLLEIRIVSGAETPPTYFAPKPISNVLASGKVEVPDFDSGTAGASEHTYSDVDLDTDMALLFSAVDGLLSPRSAPAAERLAAPAFALVVHARRSLARSYSRHQLFWLFRQQTPPPGRQEDDLTLAQHLFSAQLDDSLLHAYEVRSVLQCPVDWQAADAGQGLTSTVTLYGTVEPRSATGSAARGKAFTNTTAKIALTPGRAGARPGGRLSFASSVKQASGEPGQAPVVTLPLSYRMTYVVLDDTSGQARPTRRARWLRLVEPVRVDVGTGDTVIPVPLRQFPIPPTLVEQGWKPKVSGNGGRTGSIRDLRTWSYEYQFQYLDAPQDSIETSVEYNHPLTSAFNPLAARDAESAALDLPDALALFKAGYARVRPILATLPDLTHFPPGSEEARAVEYFAELVRQVVDNKTWARAVAPEEVRDGAPRPSVDRYAVSFVDEVPAGCHAAADGRASAILEIKSLSGAAALAHTTVTPFGKDGRPIPEDRLRRCPYEAGQDTRYVVYDPRQTDGWLRFRIRVGDLDVLDRQSAWSSVVTLRNVHLIDGFDTNDTFVYRSQEARATRRVTPYLSFPDLAIDVPEQTGMARGQLTDYLSRLLEIAFTPPDGHSTSAPPSYPMRVGAGLALELFEWVPFAPGKPPIAVTRSHAPILLSSTLPLASPSPAARSAPWATAGRDEVSIAELTATLASRITTFLAEAPLDVDKTSLVLSLTVFADDPDNHGAVLNLGRLVLPVRAVQPEDP